MSHRGIVAWCVRWRPELLLFVLSLGVRLFYWTHYPADAFLPSPTSWQGYLEALRQHFLEYLFYDHTQPPGLYLVHKLLLSLVGEQAFVTWQPVPGFILNSGAMLLVYSMARQLGAQRMLSWVLTAIYSVGLIPLELWVSGSTLDNYTVGLVACLAWALMGRVTGGYRQDILVAVTGGLSVLMQKVAFVVTPLLIVLTMWLLEGTAATRRKRTAVALTGPLLVTLVLMGKNLCSVGTYSPGSLAGVNVAQFMWAAHDYDVHKLREFARDAGYRSGISGVMIALTGLMPWGHFTAPATCKKARRIGRSIFCPF